MLATVIIYTFFYLNFHVCFKNQFKQNKQNGIDSLKKIGIFYDIFLTDSKRYITIIIAHYCLCQ